MPEPRAIYRVASSSASATPAPTPNPADFVDYVFVAKLENMKSVVAILKCIQIREFASLHITERGIKVSVEDVGNFQASTYLRKDMFSEYHLTEEEINFKIKIKVLVVNYDALYEDLCHSLLSEVLQMCMNAADTTGKLMYKGPGRPFSILLHEAGAGHFTECKINTLDAPKDQEYPFHTDDLICRVICTGDCMKDAFATLLAFSISSFEVAVRVHAPNLTLKTESDNVVSEVTIDKHSDLVEMFSCSEDKQLKYRPKLIKYAVKPLQIADKVSFRIDDNGTILLQFMVRTDTDVDCFVELFCAPEIDLDEEI